MPKNQKGYETGSISEFAPSNKNKEENQTKSGEDSKSSDTYSQLFITEDDGYDVVEDGFAVANEEPIATFDRKPSDDDFPDDVDALYVTQDGSQYELREALHRDDEGEPIFRDKGALSTYQYMHQTESMKFKPIEVDDGTVRVVESADIEKNANSGSINVQKLREQSDYVGGSHGVSSTSDHTFVTDDAGDVEVGQKLAHSHWRVDNMVFDNRSGKQAPDTLPKVGFENEQLVEYMDVDTVEDARSRLDVMTSDELEEFTQDYYEDMYGVEDYGEWWKQIQGLDYDGFSSKESAVIEMYNALNTDTYKDDDEQKQDPLRDSIQVEDGELRFGKNVKWTASVYTLDKFQYQGDMSQEDGWPDVSPQDVLYARFGRQAGESTHTRDLGASEQLSRADAKRVIENWDEIDYDTVEDDLLEILEDGNEETREYLADLMSPYVMATKHQLETENVGLEQSVSLGEMPVFGSNVTIYKAKHYCNKECSTCPHGGYRRYAWRDGDTTRTRYVG
jgi:hypothetical protein